MAGARNSQSSTGHSIPDDETIIDLFPILTRTGSTPYRGTKRGQSSAGGEGQGPRVGLDRVKRTLNNPHRAGEQPMQFRWGSLRLAFGHTNYPHQSAVFVPLLLIAIAVCLADCSAARVTQPSPVGPDTFTLSSRTFHGRTDTARDAAVSAANQHCTRLSKKLLLLRSSTNTNFRANETVTNSDADEAVVDVTFRCLAAGDSELRKPSGSPQQ